MKCYVCDTYFCYTSWSSPAEPCDCGACIVALELRDAIENGDNLRADEIETMKREWKQEQTT